MDRAHDTDLEQRFCGPLLPAVEAIAQASGSTVETIVQLAVRDWIAGEGLDADLLRQALTFAPRGAKVPEGATR